MSSGPEAEFDAIVAGGGIVGAACAHAFARDGLRTALVERGSLGGGATAAGMGHLVVLDGSAAELALCDYSLKLWHALAPTLPAAAEFVPAGTLWVAADAEEMSEAERKCSVLHALGLGAQLLSAGALAEAEPHLRGGLAGGLRVPGDSIVYPPVAAAELVQRARARGAVLYQGRAVTRLGHGEAHLDDGTVLRAPRLVNAMGVDAGFGGTEPPVRKRKGHLAITDRYPNLIRHQIVELGYMKSAHSVSEDSVACNLQPRATGQILIGSSRQFGVEDATVEQKMLSRMLQRALGYVPALGRCTVVRTWTGFRAATPDKLPLIGGSPTDATLFLATGHEGLGITTSLGTAELLAAAFAGRTPAIPAEPYLPARLSANQSIPGAAGHESKEHA